MVHLAAVRGADGLKAVKTLVPRAAANAPRSPALAVQQRPGDAISTRPTTPHGAERYRGAVRRWPT